MKRNILRIDDVLDMLKSHPNVRFSVRELQEKLMFGDRRTISVLLMTLMKYEGIRREYKYTFYVYYYMKKNKK